MRVFISAVLLMLLGSMQSAFGQVIAIERVSVLPMHDAYLYENQTIIIEGDRIVRIGPARDVRAPQGATRIDGRGKFVIPGLTEMHGHVPPMTPFQGLPERYLDDVLFLYLAGGVTTVRGMLGYPHQLRLRDDSRNGERLGPTLYLAGPSFSGNSIDSTASARSRVQEQAEAGWDLLKIHPGLSLAEFQVIAQEAKEQSIDFAGHVPSEVGVHHAIVQGIRTIDHLDGYMAALGGMDSRVSDEALREMAQFTRAHNVAVVPTQAVWETIIGAADPDALQAYPELRYLPQQIRDGWSNFLSNPRSPFYTGDTAALHAENRQRLLRTFYEEGVTILFGTDAPQLYSVPGLSVPREVRLMAAAGMKPYDIIYSGTAATGAYFADKDTFGTITPGARADLLLLNGNPLESLEYLSRPEGVMVRGRYLSRADIDARLAEIEAAYNN
ncbi:MAG: amidohydrolase family protein [Idiomarina sp.]|nr:amidohydrolase family protein [Idiomarina sp.]